MLKPMIVGLFLINCFSLLGTDYILYIRAKGSLGTELRTYWNAVKNDKTISHDAITTYPPHCSLTGFFPKEKSKTTYVHAIEKTIHELESMPQTITINGLIQHNAQEALDYIKLSSSYLLAVTKAFMHNASIPDHYLKNPADFTYHITLRNHVFHQNIQKKMHAIQKLEKKINLHASVTWSLFLYEKEDNGDLSVIEEFPL